MLIYVTGSTLADLANDAGGINLSEDNDSNIIGKTGFGDNVNNDICSNESQQLSHDWRITSLSKKITGLENDCSADVRYTKITCLA